MCFPCTFKDVDIDGEDCVSVINPLFRAHTVPLSNLHGDVCAICTNKFNMLTYVYFTACGHHFHKHCLSRWSVYASSCPMCRKDYEFAVAVRLTF